MTSLWKRLIEGDWFTITENRQQWSTICEQFHLSDVVGGVTDLLNLRPFHVHVVILLSVPLLIKVLLTYALLIRHSPPYNIMNSWF